MGLYAGAVQPVAACGKLLVLRIRDGSSPTDTAQKTKDAAADKRQPNRTWGRLLLLRTWIHAQLVWVS